ncbi:phage anti-repressor protein [Allocoleopsis franciscana PCC 7113]|uniref:Phage anti-repressor protein n=2 Tax=Allocoleopsis TaxID=2886347 RepID=K9WBE7_9CYAN|nr:phage anti-repressor protein [Allocoleopsis franciscana PCC 7113]
MTELAVIKRKLPEAMIFDFLNAKEDCTIDLVMLVELEVYSSKNHAFRALKRNFEEGIEFSYLKDKASQMGVLADIYLLTSDCFKEMCMLAETPTGKLVRKYYIEVERRWKRKQKERSKQVAIQPSNSNSSEQIEKLIDELIDLAFKVCWASADYVNNIQVRTAQEQKRLRSAFENQVDRQLLYSIAKKALTDVSHNVSHQHAAIIGIAEKQLEPYREYVLTKLQEWQEQQSPEQPALSPAEEFPVQRTSSDRRRAVIAFIFGLIDQYGSLDAIPRRGKGKAGINLEVEWGTNRLSQMFGVSSNTVLDIWREVEEAIKKYGEISAWHRLL